MQMRSTRDRSMNIHYSLKATACYWLYVNENMTSYLIKGLSADACKLVVMPAINYDNVGGKYGNEHCYTRMPSVETFTGRAYFNF